MWSSKRDLPGAIQESAWKGTHVWGLLAKNDIKTLLPMKKNRRRNPFAPSSGPPYYTAPPPPPEKAVLNDTKTMISTTITMKPTATMYHHAFHNNLLLWQQFSFYCATATNLCFSGKCIRISVWKCLCLYISRFLAPFLFVVVSFRLPFSSLGSLFITIFPFSISHCQCCWSVLLLVASCTAKESEKNWKRIVNK